MRVLFFVVRVRKDSMLPATVMIWLSRKRVGPSSAAKSLITAPMGTAPIFRTASRYSSMGWPVR